MFKVLQIILLLSLVSCASSVQHKASESTDKFGANATERVNQLIERGMNDQKTLDELFLIASDASLSGNTKLSVRAYEGLTLLSPNRPFLMKKYAIELLRDGQVEKATPILKGLFLQDKRDSSLSMLLAGAYSALGKKNEAEKTFKTTLELNPGHEEACLFLAKSHVERKKIELAKKQIAHCQKSAPKTASFSYMQGKIALEESNLKLAKKYFKKSLKIDPRYAQGHLGLGLVNELSSKFEEALAAYDRYLELVVKEERPLVLGRILQILFSKEMHARAIPYAEQMVELSPDNLNLKVKLGVLYTEHKRFNKARELFKAVLREVPDSDKILYYLGVLSIQVGELDEAVGYLLKVSSEGPFYKDSNMQIAQILEGRAKEGLAQGRAGGKELKEFERFVFERAPLLKESSLDLYGPMASHYDLLGSYSKAIDTLLKVEAPLNKDYSFFLASLYEKEGAIKKARKVVEGILRKDGQEPYALNFLGYSFLEHDLDFKKAYSHIQKAVKILPQDAYIRDSLGWYYFKKGELKKAKKEIQRALKIVKDDAIINKHMAMVHYELGEIDQARYFFSLAINQSKGKWEKDKVTQAIQKRLRTLGPSGRWPTSLP